MTFGSPEWLSGLLVVPLAVAVYVWSRRRRARRAATLAGQGLVTTAAGSGRDIRRHLPFALFAVALTLMAIAVARPMATVTTPRAQATVMLVMDVSNSMAATDVKPSRLDVAKKGARTFVRDQPMSVKLGVVAFGPRAVIVQSPTFNHSAVLRAIKQLSIGGGTSLATGILTALDAIAGKTLIVNPTRLNQDNSRTVNIGYYPGATIVLFSDGEDTSQTDPVALARLSSLAGVPIQAVGVGTVAGTAVKIGGFSVATALDPQTLKEVAKVTNGGYHQIDNRAALSTISKGISLHSVPFSRHIQVSAVFAMVGAVFLVLGALLSVSWFGRVL